MKPVTIWYRQISSSEAEFNHIEDGFDYTRTIPTAVSDEQRKNWKGVKWAAIEGTISDDHVVTEVS